MFEFEKNIGLKPGDTFAHLEVRKEMIKSQIIARGVKNPAVLRAIEKVPRHRFVNERLENSAYDDAPLPIGEGQTISQPFIVAYMTAALELKGGEKILEVGAGSGYQTVVLSEIVEHVYTIEINENLTIDVSMRLKKIGSDNVSLKFGNGYKGWPEHAPFDGIIVTAAPDAIPQSLVEQLKIGGKMVIPVGKTNQNLIVVTKFPDGSVEKEPRFPVRFVPMIRETEKEE